MKEKFTIPECGAGCDRRNCPQLGVMRKNLPFNLTACERDGLKAQMKGIRLDSMHQVDPETWECKANKTRAYLYLAKTKKEGWGPVIDAEDKLRHAGRAKFLKQLQEKNAS